MDNKLGNNYKISTVFGCATVTPKQQAVITPFFIYENEFGRGIINWTVGVAKNKLPNQEISTIAEFDLSDLGKMKLEQLKSIEWNGVLSSESPIIAYEILQGIKQTITEKVIDICRSAAGGTKILLVVPDNANDADVYEAFDINPFMPPSEDRFIIGDMGGMLTATEPFIFLTEEDMSQAYTE